MKQHLKVISNELDTAISFHPLAPIINVNFQYDKINLKVDWDIVECLSFIDSPANWKE